MKKKDLKKLALLGIAGGLIAVSQGSVQADQNNTNNNLMVGLIAAGCKTCKSYAPPRTRGSNIAEADETTTDTDEDTDEDNNDDYKDSKRMMTRPDKSGRS